MHLGPWSTFLASDCCAGFPVVVFSLWFTLAVFWLWLGLWLWFLFWLWLWFLLWFWLWLWALGGGVQRAGVRQGEAEEGGQKEEEGGGGGD